MDIGSIMKYAIILLASILSGCASDPILSVSRYTQNIEGDAYIRIETFLQDTSAEVTNGRIEDGYFVADVVRIDHRGKWTKTKVTIKIDGWKRPVVESE